jgi:glycosyl transferase, family 25
MEIKDYFERIYVIHLPERVDRYIALERELRMLGIDLKGGKVRIPHAPRPTDANQFSSRAVYGNFLSHLAILKEAREERFATVLVLEDDAIFSRRMVKNQAALVQTLRDQPWDLCFFGHSLKHELHGCAKGLVAHRAGFTWAHCYGVNARVLPRLIDYLETTMILQPGDPRGARMYIDGAFTLFRERNPDVVALVSNPVLSVQKGSPSSIAGKGWYRSLRFINPLINMARAVRDEFWRLTA